MKNQENFRHLVVWDRAMELCLSLYDNSLSFHEWEYSDIDRLLKENSIDCMSKIAIGNSQKDKSERLRYFYEARHALIKIDCLLELCSSLRILKKNEIAGISETLKNTMGPLHNLINAVENPEEKK